MIVDARWAPCDRCNYMQLPGNDLCTCTPLRDPAVLDLMERVVAARHRASVKLAVANTPRGVKAA